MKLKWKIIAGVLVAAAVGYFFVRRRESAGTYQIVRELKPERGSITKAISATGTVEPQNRLEMKPPVAGRIDQILIKEGDVVKAGQPVVLMSSTERAALLDAAKSKGEKELSYWEDVYKPISLIAPIDGTVIVSRMQPGQSVAQTDPVVVLSDRLIVQAQVDETDIGRVKEGQRAEISLDAYPDIDAKAVVGHIYHESTIVNNVTIYQVDIIPDEVPPVFRSGMSANVKIIEEEKNDVLLVPQEAVKHTKKGDFVMVWRGKNEKPERRPVTLGLSDDADVEIVSGADEGDTLVIMAPKAAKGGKPTGSNPFMPGGRRGGSGGSASKSR